MATAKVSKKERKNKVANDLDFNKNGIIEIEDIIVLALKTPGIKITRSDFLTKELSNRFDGKIVKKAIETTPLEAGISKDNIELIADDIVKFERNCVSGLSGFFGIFGGPLMVATISADIVQYFGFMIRAAQKLMYLYGFQQIVIDDGKSSIDSTTINTLTICLGAMYGIAAANNALIKITEALAVGVEKKLLQASLTKGWVYPVVKSISKWFGKKMTKAIFASVFRKAIPVVGAGLSFVNSFLSFPHCCNNLRKALRESYLFNKEGKQNKDNTLIVEKKEKQD